MTDGGGELFGIEKRRAIVALVLAGVLGFGALALLGQATSLTKAAKAVGQADKLWFLGLLGGELVAYGGYAIGYRAMARACGGPVFTLWTTLRLSVASFGAYVVASSAGGLGVDFWAIHHSGVAVHETGRRVLAFNILEWGVLGSFAAAAGAVELVRGGTAPPGMAIAWIAVTPFCVAGALAVSQGRLGERLSRLPRHTPAAHGWLTRSRLRWALSEAHSGLADAVGSLVFLRMILARPRRYPDAPGGFALYWIGDLFTLDAAVHALGGRIGITELVLAYATGYIVTSAPLPAGAAGFSEATTSFSLHLGGISLGTAIIAVFLYRVFTFWLPIVPAILVLPHVRQLADSLPDAPREPDPPCAVDVER